MHSFYLNIDMGTEEIGNDVIILLQYHLLKSKARLFVYTNIILNGIPNNG